MSTTIERNKLIHRALRSPVLPGVNVVFGVIVGLIAATFHADLSNAVALVNLTHGFDIAYGPWNWLAFWFWALLCIKSQMMVVRKVKSSGIVSTAEGVVT